jgi:NADH:ubiquinone oxidoreductase subunit 4 (subunit M)
MPGTIGFISEVSLIIGIFEKFELIALLLFVPICICSYRNYLLFSQICMGIPSNNMFGPYKLNKDISITQKKKFQENEILFIKN